MALTKFKHRINAFKDNSLLIQVDGAFIKNNVRAEEILKSWDKSKIIRMHIDELRSLLNT